MNWELDKAEQAWFKFLLSRYNQVMVYSWRNNLVIRGSITGRINIIPHLKLLFIIKAK